MDEKMRQKVLSQLSLRKPGKKIGDWSRVDSVHDDVWGDASEIVGSVFGNRGDVSEIIEILKS